MSKDELGKPFKELEAEAQIVLPAEKFLCIRIDGKNFSNWTKGCQQPFDWGVSYAMIQSGVATCENVDKAQLAYIQSDECSIIVAPALHEHWFGGKVQKITSVTASIFTATFNTPNWVGKTPAHFDSRVFALDDLDAVAQYLRWRQIDNRRNFVNSVARMYFSHSELNGVGHHDRLDLLEQKGVNLEDYDKEFQGGVLIFRDTEVVDISWENDRTGETHIEKDVERSFWNVKPSPRFRDVGDLNEYIKVERTLADA